MVTKDKIQKDKNIPYKDKENIELPMKLLESPSSWTALVLNEKLWMRKALFIGKISTWLGLKSWAFRGEKVTKCDFFASHWATSTLAMRQARVPAMYGRLARHSIQMDAFLQLLGTWAHRYVRLGISVQILYW
jgi:hypothetical protein